MLTVIIAFFFLGFNAVSFVGMPIRKVKTQKCADEHNSREDQIKMHKSPVFFVVNFKFFQTLAQSIAVDIQYPRRAQLAAAGYFHHRLQKRFFYRPQKGTVETFFVIFSLKALARKATHRLFKRWLVALMRHKLNFTRSPGRRFRRYGYGYNLLNP